MGKNTKETKVSKKNIFTKTLYLLISNISCVVSLEELFGNDATIYTTLKEAKENFTENYGNYIVEVKMGKIFTDKETEEVQLKEIKLKERS